MMCQMILTSGMHQLYINDRCVEVAAVPPGDPTGNRSVSININFTTQKDLMYRYKSDFYQAVSEAKIFQLQQ